MVLAAGESMAAMPYDTRRTMVYCLWSGEEGGLRGSDYWTDTLSDRYYCCIVHSLRIFTV